MEGYILAKVKKGRPKMRCFQDITDDLQMSAQMRDILLKIELSSEIKGTKFVMSISFCRNEEPVCLL
jgi:hypothetical protein